MAAVGSGGDRDATAPGLQINEGDSVTVTITANGLTAGRVLGSLNYGGGTAIYGQNADYLGPNSGSATSSYGITHPATSQAFTITTRDDSDPEGDETFVLSLPSAPVHLDTSGAATGDQWTNGAPTSITVTILANDGYTPPTPTPTPSFSIAVDESTRAAGQGHGEHRGLALGAGGFIHGDGERRHRHRRRGRGVAVVGADGDGETGGREGDGVGGG